MARFLWSTVPTPATPWPVTPLLPRRPGRTVRLRTPPSADLRSSSRHKARRRRTWRTIATTGTSRDRTYSTRAPCTTQSRSKAWELFINTDFQKERKKKVPTFFFYPPPFSITRYSHRDSAEQSWDLTRDQLTGFWMTVFSELGFPPQSSRGVFCPHVAAYLKDIWRVFSSPFLLNYLSLLL